MKYVHTNIIARDWQKLSKFYQEVFDCVPLLPRRDLQGPWLDELTGITNTQIQGEHLALPGYDSGTVTLEIFSYGEMNSSPPRLLNDIGFGHLAFEVEDVATTLEKLIKHGGSVIGSIVKKDYPNIGKATLVYCRDIEGNILELQSWER